MKPFRDNAPFPPGMMRRFLQIPRWLLWGLICAAANLPIDANARSMVLEKFSVEIQVLPNGALLVTETIQPRFTGSWNGLERTIPVEYRTPQGFSYKLDLTPTSVTDDRGTPLKYESRHDRHYRSFRIWIPDAIDATRTLVFTYQVENGLKFFEDHDELYWNVTGDEWDVPIESASARILLPANATGIRALAFTGAYGAREQAAEVTVTGPEISMRMTRVLGFREGLTAVAGWDKGLVAEPAPIAVGWRFLKDNWPLTIPLGVFLVMYRLWITRGRDPRLRPITVAYEPPEGLTPAELGTLVDNSPDLRDITATIVDLAIRGYLRIEERSAPKLLGLWSGVDYKLHSLKPVSEWAGLLAHERQLLGALFEQGEKKELAMSDLENRFYSHLPAIRDQMFERLLSRRYYAHRPDRIKQTYVTIGLILTFIGAVLGAVLSPPFGLAQGPTMLAGIASGLIVAAFGWIMPARTTRGARTLEGVLGFEEFLTKVEAPRYEKIAKTPELFEKFLPFAMALGVEQNWVRAFESIYTQPPTWYAGTDPTGFHPRSFVSSLAQMSNRAETVMASAPRSAGESGFSSSGGFSGGGFGGGGGRGF